MVAGLLLIVTCAGCYDCEEQVDGCKGGPEPLDDSGRLLEDVDGDGWASEEGDCDDRDGSINPDASEVCDGLDNDCDGEIDEDPLADSEDAIEVCDRLDNDCDGEIDEGVTVTTWYDADQDGYGVAGTEEQTCSDQLWRATQAGDCDDGNWYVHPAATETCDGIDNNCDGDIDEGCDTGA